MTVHAVQPHALPFEANPDARTGVLLCHGFTGSTRSMRPWAEALATQGLRVDLPRLPGHGTDWHELTVAGWQDWYACVERRLHVLRRECDRVFVCGLSMGGALALRLAEHHPVDGLVLVNPSIGSDELRMRALPVLRRLVASVGAIANDVAKQGVDEGAYHRTPLAGVWSMTQLWTDVTANLARVECDVLLMTSETDHVVDGASRRVITQHVPHVAEVRLPDSFHLATLDHDAALVEQRSLEFIRDHGGLG